MLVFPQFSTGAAALYPLRRTRRRRTVVNSLADGTRVTYSDPDFAEKRWDLQCIGMTADEWLAIEALFGAVQGRRDVFTLLEPAGNLLAQSADLASTVWQSGPLVNVVDGVVDPFGGSDGWHVTNAGPVAAGLAQVLAVPGNFQYALSVWARAGSVSELTLFAETTGGQTSRTFGLAGGWRRCVIPVGLAQATESVKFGIRLEGSVDVCGMQVEAQLGAGGYQATGANGGVYSQVRFGMDELVVRARGTDVFDATLRIVSKGS
jgi:hypothetical protein